MGASGARLDRLTTVVRAVLDEHLPGGATAVVGVSGGPDSVALLHLAAAARPDVRLVVGHVRHGLRDDAPDAAAARAHADARGAAFAELPVHVGQGDGPEDAARRVRHAALLDLARDRGAAAVLLGHTMDDQAETVLLRIARGTGPDGLAGMALAVDRGGVAVLRPLLAVRRADVRARAERLAAEGLAVVEDPTNTDPAQRRARARHGVLPAMAALRPDDGDVVPALARLASLAADDAALLEAVLAERPPRRYGMAVIAPAPPEGLAEGRGGGNAPRAWASRALRRAWRMLPEAPPPPPAASIDAVLGLAVRASTDVAGGVRVHRIEGGWVLVGSAHPRLPEVALAPDRPVTVPGHQVAYTLQTAFSATGRPGSLLHERPTGGPPWQADLARPACGVAGMVVRGRHPDGDRGIRKALQRVPEPLRDQVPIVAAADGTVLMVGTEVLCPPPADGHGVRIRAEAWEEGGRRYPAPP